MRNLRRVRQHRLLIRQRHRLIDEGVIVGVALQRRGGDGLFVEDGELRFGGHAALLESRQGPVRLEAGEASMRRKVASCPASIRPRHSAAKGRTSPSVP